MKQQIKVLQELLEHSLVKRTQALEISEMFKRKMVNAEVKHHHLLGKLVLAVRELQEIRDFVAQCHEDNLSPDTSELFEDLQSIMDNLKTKPSNIFYKMKNKHLHMDQFIDKEWTVIVWE